MFETLHPLSRSHLDAGADALQADGAFAVLMDPQGVYGVFRACRNHEVDFACCVADKDGSWISKGLTPDQYEIVAKWMGETVPLLCRIWKRRHTTDAHPTAEPWVKPGLDQ